MQVGADHFHDLNDGLAHWSLLRRILVDKQHTQIQSPIKYLIPSFTILLYSNLLKKSSHISSFSEDWSIGKRLNFSGHSERCDGDGNQKMGLSSTTVSEYYAVIHVISTRVIRVAPNYMDEGIQTI